MITRVEESVASGNGEPFSYRGARNNKTTAEHTMEQLLNICQNLNEQKESLENEGHSQDIKPLFKTTERLRRHIRAISGTEVMRGLVKELITLFVAIADIYAFVLKVREVAATSPVT